MTDLNHSDILGESSQSGNNETSSDGKAVSGPCSDAALDPDYDYFGNDDTTL